MLLDSCLTAVVLLLDSTAVGFYEKINEKSLKYLRNSKITSTFAQLLGRKAGSVVILHLKRILVLRDYLILRYYLI